MHDAVARVLAIGHMPTKLYQGFLVSSGNVSLHFLTVNYMLICTFLLVKTINSILL